MKSRSLFVPVLVFALFMLANVVSAIVPTQPISIEVSALVLPGEESLFPDFVAGRDESQRSALVQAGLRLSAEHYLADDFCRDGLCAEGAWSEWLIVDEESTWNVTRLRTIRGVLLETIQALDSTGLDGRRLLAGYHFRYQPGEHLHGRPQSIALVQHETGQIIVTDEAFTVADGFALYHELGHVVDQRLGRRLSRQFIHEIGGGLDHKHMESGKLVPDGYRLRESTSHSQYEAAADAFGIWMVIATATEPPVFRTTPGDVDYRAIARTVAGVLEDEAAVQRNPIRSLTRQILEFD